MNKRRIFIPVVIIGLLAAGWFIWTKTRRPAPLVLSGALEARHIEVGSLLGGRVREVQVDEGATVAAGQPLLTFETDLIDRQIDEQKALIAAAQAGLSRARRGPRAEELARARLDWENAERERVRAAQLLQSKLTPQSAYDGTATLAATALESYRQLQRGSRVEDIDQARAGFEQQAARLAYLLRQREESVVRAPAVGRVEVFDLRPGDLVAPNQPVASILEAGQLWIRIYVPEPNLARIRVGDAAQLSVDGSDRKFPGKIAQIREQAEYTPRNVQTLNQRFDQVFAVKVTLDPAPELKPGMAALVTLSQ
jgi:multidrug resistance efflux pump